MSDPHVPIETSPPCAQVAAMTSIGLKVLKVV